MGMAAMRESRVSTPYGCSLQFHCWYLTWICRMVVFRVVTLCSILLVNGSIPYNPISRRTMSNCTRIALNTCRNYRYDNNLVLETFTEAWLRRKDVSIWWREGIKTFLHHCLQIWENTEQGMTALCFHGHCTSCRISRKTNLTSACIPVSILLWMGNCWLLRSAALISSSGRWKLYTSVPGDNQTLFESRDFRVHDDDELLMPALHKSAPSSATATANNLLAGLPVSWQFQMNQPHRLRLLPYKRF